MRIMALVSVDLRCDFFGAPGRRQVDSGTTWLTTFQHSLNSRHVTPNFTLASLRSWSLGFTRFSGLARTRPSSQARQSAFIEAGLRRVTAATGHGAGG